MALSGYFASFGLRRFLPLDASRRPRSLTAKLIVLGAAATLAGCGLGGGVGSLLVDPAAYDAYHCKDLAIAAAELAVRQAQLRDLMDKAQAGGGSGVVIGTLAYRSDYEAVLGREKLVKRKAAELNCQPPPRQYSSDGVIR